jgi:TnpA family transposase
MAAIHETAYPRIKPNLSHKELKEIFTPTEEELILLNSKTKNTLPAARLGFMMTLKCYQYLGRPIGVPKIDIAIRKHIADKLGIDSKLDLSGYDKSARKRHIKIIREYMQVNADKKSRRQVMKRAALESAATKENLADIINCIIDELIKFKFELPAFQKLVRLSRAARTVVNNDNYGRIFNELSEEQKKLIDIIVGIVKTDNSDDDVFSWSMLKLEPKKPSTNNIKGYVQYVNKMMDLRQKININLDFIAPARIEQLKDEATIADIHDMKEMRPVKRYAQATIFIYIKTASAIDDLVQVLITWIKSIEAQAKSKLEEYRLEQAGKTDEYVLLLYKTLLALKNNDTAQDKIQEIEEQLSGNTDALIEQCREYLGLTGENHITWMLKPYNNKRHVIFQLLENLSVLSSTNDKSIEIGLKFIMYYRHSHKEWIELDNDNLIQPDLSLLSDGWFKAVTGLKREKNLVAKKINRHYYEIAVCTTLTGDLNCGDAYVENAFIFDDPNKQLITWEQFDVEFDGYCDLVKLSKERGKFIGSLQNRLRQTAKKVNENYHDNPYLIIDKGWPILKKLPKKKEHPDLNKIRQMIMDEMPIKSIVDVIVEVENWLSLSVYFKPHSGYETKIADYPPRFVATSLSYGCNMGPTQTERSLLKFTRKQIAWLFNHHVTDHKLIKAIHALINRYNTFDLPKHWGPGDSLSVDGTFWDMYTQNLLAAHHIRYGRYGGVGYYHVSDQYIALFSNFISCGAYESVYLLDGIVENDSDIQPKKVHGDSWAQSEVLFGLASLLAISIMPRIKQFKHLNYYKASSKDHYENINELFTEKPVDWELIETHYHDMLRVAISIHKGKIKSSTVLRKLCSKSRKKKLYFAFRELGRVERTIFLLNYINDPVMRGMIQAATCKSEEFNQFISWIRFGGGGIISDNMRSNQRKIIRFNHLLANMLVFHTVVYQTKAVNKLRGQDVEISNEILSGISPYWTEHLNRFGMFQLDMEKTAAEIEYDLISSEI